MVLVFMPLVKFILDKEKDAWNIWRTINNPIKKDKIPLILRSGLFGSPLTVKILIFCKIAKNNKKIKAKGKKKSNKP